MSDFEWTFKLSESVKQTRYYTTAVEFVEESLSSYSTVYVNQTHHLPSPSQIDVAKKNKQQQQPNTLSWKPFSLTWQFRQRQHFQSSFHWTKTCNELSLSDVPCSHPDKQKNFIGFIHKMYITVLCGQLQK